MLEERRYSEDGRLGASAGIEIDAGGTVAAERG